MSWIPTATLFVMMLALGMTLRAEDFRRLARAPRAVVFGLLGQLVLLPAVAFAIGAGLALPPVLAIGLVLIAACPGGVTSNVLSLLARGDVALSISLTAASSVVSFLTVPFLVGLSLRIFGGEGGDGGEVVLSLGEMMATLFGTTALPVLLGMALLHVRPALAGRLHRPLLGLSTTVLLVLIAGLAFSMGWSEVDVSGLAARAAPAVVLLLATTTGIGLLGGRMLGVGAAATRTLVLEIGVQNFNLALVVALGLLEEPLYAGAAIIYLPVMFAFAAGLIVVARRRRAPDGPTAHEWGALP